MGAAGGAGGLFQGLGDNHGKNVARPRGQVQHPPKMHEANLVTFPQKWPPCFRNEEDSCELTETT